MKPVVKQQEAQLRCYKCGSPEITTICHHCGRPMCSQHPPINPGLSFFTENREFERLDLGDWPITQKEGCHCEYHVHSTLNYRRLLIIPGVIIMVIGLFMLLGQITGWIGCIVNLPAPYRVELFRFSEILRDPAWFVQEADKLPVYQCYAPSLTPLTLRLLRPLLVLGAGLAALLIGRRLDKLKFIEETMERPGGLPISPATSGFQVTETMNVYYKLRETGDVDTSLAGAVEGNIQPYFRFMPADFHRLGHYQSIHHLSSSRNVPFQGGFIILEGGTRIEPEENWGNDMSRAANPGDRYQADHPNRIWIEGESDQHPYLTGQKGRMDPSWPVQFHYRVWPQEGAPVDEWRQVPLRIVPRLVERGKTRLVTLEVQLNTAFFPGLRSQAQPEPGQVTPEQVIFLERSALLMDADRMGVPVSDGVVEFREEGSRRYHLVEWSGLWEPVSDQPITRMNLPEIRFDQEVPPDARIEGEMVFRIPALTSGIRRVNYFSALGGKVRSKEGAASLPQTLFTRLRVKISLCLPRLAATQLISLPTERLERGGGPTQTRIEKIIRALNSSAMNDPNGQIFVRRVVENLPQFGDSNLGQYSRSTWDLSGRYYHYTYPVDYHVVVYGRGDENQGNTSIEITVQSQLDINAGDAARDRQYLQATAALLKSIIIQVCETKG